MNSLSHFRRLMMFTCKDANDFLTEYMEGTLPPAMEARFERHITNCKQCTAYLDQYRRTIKLVRENAGVDAELPTDLVDATLSFLRQHYDEPPDINDAPGANGSTPDSE